MNRPIREISSKLGVSMIAVVNVKKRGIERKKRKKNAKKPLIDEVMGKKIKKLMKERKGLEQEQWLKN